MNKDIFTAESISKQILGRGKPKVEYLKGGINNVITGGTIAKVVFEDNGEPHSFVLKITPDFLIEQSTLQNVLDSSGHEKLGHILKNYPNNQIGLREIEFYKFIKPYEYKFIPKVYASQNTKPDSRSVLFMEDLTNSKDLATLEKSPILTENLTTIITTLANFHFDFFLKKDELKNQHWLGNWWQVRNSDFLSKEVAMYSYKYCSKFIIDPDIKSLLDRFLEKRELVWDKYNGYFLNTLIHWDLNPSNVLIPQVAPNNFKIIDWQLATIGIPQWDLAQLLVPFLNSLGRDGVDKLIDIYLNQMNGNLDANQANIINKNEFLNLFNVVVLDHSFRLSISVLLSGKASGSEWEKCMDWVSLTKKEINTFLERLD